MGIRQETGTTTQTHGIKPLLMKKDRFDISRVFAAGSA
jgi:hypothetical protein